MRLIRFDGGLFAWATVLVALSGLVLGGGTRPGFIGDALLQLIALPLLIASLWRLPSGAPRSALLFCLALALVPLIQLIPLPADLRAMLPGKTWIDQTYQLIGKDSPSWPISMVPEATWLAWLALIPPFAVYFAILGLSRNDRRQLARLFVAFATVSVFLGLFQLAQGPNSWLRPFAFTNNTEAVGFFANRNHYSALLYCALLFSACWFIDAANKVRRAIASGTHGRRFDSVHLLTAAAAILIFVCIVAAQAMARSRAGLALTLIALVGVMGLVVTDPRSREEGRNLAKTIAVVVVFAILFALQYALFRIMERFSTDPLEDARVTFARNTWAAAKAYLPFGSGVGTFPNVYPLFEQPQDLATFYANHAHNDVLEALLESGVFAALLILLFTFWLLRRLITAWWRPSAIDDHHAADMDTRLRKAATLSMVLIALHSFVDYPLRTSAMLVLVAFCCGLLAPVLFRSTDTQQAPSEPSKRQPAEPSFAPAPTHATTQWPQQPPPVARPWQAPAEWPKEWQQSSKPGRAHQPSTTPIEDQEPPKDDKR